MPRLLNYVGNEGSYGRVTGLGQIPCSDVTLSPGFVGPVDCDPTNGGPNYPVGQNQISQIWGYLNDTIGQSDGTDYVPPAPSVSGSLTDFLKKNWPVLVIGVGIAVVLKRG